MTRRKEKHELQQHSFNLFAGDFDRIRELTEKDPSFVIRRLVRKFIERIEGNQTEVKIKPEELEDVL